MENATNNVIKFFKILSEIPRESKNESKVADYLVEFAKQYNLSFYRDNFNNVLIKKVNPLKQPIILQSHTDMVCVKEENYNFDFNSMPLKLVEKDGFISAYKTSLGADNGIGVAIILSLLSGNNNYNIEALFTTDEEVTMTGATNFDYSKLQGNKLISLDGFSSTQLINGCASICDMKINFKPEFTSNNETGFKLTVSGLKGGHSGADIDKNIGNAVNILTEMLLGLEDSKLEFFEGGNQFNFIPNSATACFTSNNFLSKIETLKTNYKSLYSNIKISYKKNNIKKTLTQEYSYKLLSVLSQIKTGVIKKDSGGNIVVSQNLSSVNLKDGLIKISERAHNNSEEDNQILFLKNLAENNGFTFSIFDKQAGLIPLEISTLTKTLCELNKKINNQNLEVSTKHISLEGAIFKQKKEDFDIVIISPDIYDVHSTSERVFVPSISKTYNLLKGFLDIQ